MIERIVLTVPSGDEDYCRNVLMMASGLKDDVEIIAGGSVRQASVYNGLQSLADYTIVVIHDGVRPLISEEIITNTIKAAQDTGAALAGVPVRDTLKRKTGARLETIPRSDLWLAHTPQSFVTSLIIGAHKKALEDGFTGTDDAALVERMGNPVTIVEDSEDNIKITTQKDLELASILIRRRALLADSRR